MRRFFSLRGKKNESDLSLIQKNKDESNKIDVAAENALLRGKPIDLSEVFSDAPRVENYRSLGPFELDTNFADIPVDVAARSYGAYGEDYQKEYVLMVLHRLLLRGLKNRLIARIFNVSERTISRWKTLLKERFREEAENMEFSPFVGETIMFYRSIIEEALKTSSNLQISVREKLFALNVAMDARKDMTKFLDTVGFFDSNRLSGKRDVDESIKQVEELRKLSRELSEAYKNHNISEFREPRFSIVGKKKAAQ